MSPPAAPPIRIALIDDYDVVLAGLAGMLASYHDRVLVAEIDANKPLTTDVDIALCDSFAQRETDHIDVLAANPHARRVVVYTWNFHPDLVAAAVRSGAAGYLSKTLPASELVDALEAVHAGRTVISDPPGRARVTSGSNWPGRGEGLTEREAELLALITQGHNNAEIATITYLSPNTVKSYIRTIFRKINARNRTQAALWGVRHGFAPDHDRISQWRNPP